MTSAKRTTPKRRTRGAHDGAKLGFEEQLWKVADEMRGRMEPAEYKHVVLGVLFLRNCLSFGDTGSLSVPRGVTWASLLDSITELGARSALISALDKVECANPEHAGAFPRPPDTIDNETLERLVRGFDRIPLPRSSIEARDVLGRVYEYFLAKFASAEGRSGGEYYTPRSVVQLLVKLVRPTNGVVYDPCCGTGGLFIQSEEFLEAQGGTGGDVRIFGQESSLTTWRLARTNLAMHGINADLGATNGDTFFNDQHRTLKADYILANPPFNMKNWGAGRLGSDARWAFGTPPPGNANYAWIQHIIHHLAADGLAGFVMSNGALSSDQGGEGAIRERMVESGVIECIVALPSQLFYGTQIPACLWLVSPKRKTAPGKFKGQTLFIDARKFGHLVDRVHAELSGSEIDKIADACPPSGLMRQIGGVE